MIGRHYLSRLLEPRSVALAGASDNPAKVGGRMLDNLLAGGFEGAIHAVNPKHATVRGLRCHASYLDLPEAPDLAIIVTPARTVAGILEDCARKGTRNAVVISGGFREAGAEGARLEARLLDTARRHGIRLLGPNCLGLLRPPLGLDATFARGGALPGTLALVSQSGAVCTAMLDWARAAGIGFSSVISLGGSSDVDFGEVIDYLASDPKTEHILLYIEGVRDGRRLVGSMRAAARAKPVIVMKVGRHPAGSRAAVSHTGAIVGNDDIFDAVVRRTGAVRVQTLRDLVGAAHALGSHVHPSGDRLAVVTNGGGPGVIAADRAVDLGIRLAALAPQTIERLEKALPPHWSHANPLDLIGDAGRSRYEAAVAACLADPGVDGVVALLTPQAMTDARDCAEGMIAAARGASKPVVACWMGEASVSEARALLHAAGISTFADPEGALDTFAHLAAFYRNQLALLEAPGPLASVEAPDLAEARRLIARALGEGRALLSAMESKALLAAFHIPVAAALPAASADEAAAQAARIGYPVAMKVDSPDITHKSDVGGVKLGLVDEEAVRAAYRSMMAACARIRPEARVHGVSVEPMVAERHGRELMAGIVRDAIFGPAIAFGAGGIAIEVLRDRAVALPPLNTILAGDMIRSTRVSKTLGAFRSMPPVQIEALEAVLLRLSEIACELPEVVELDVNPLVAHEGGVVALDARVVVRAAEGGRPYAHLAVAPYPAALARAVRLRDGAEVLLRPIRPEDATLEREFIARLSPQSMRLRFLSGLRSLTPAMLARFTQIDYDREMAFVAIARDAGAEKEVAVARYVTLPDGGTCEYAIVVEDAWQGRGLGAALMSRLIEVARERGLKQMVGYVLTTNSGMLDLCSALGFRLESDPEDRQLRRVALDLEAPRATAAA